MGGVIKSEVSWVGSLREHEDYSQTWWLQVLPFTEFRWAHFVTTKTNPLEPNYVGLFLREHEVWWLTPLIILNSKLLCGVISDNRLRTTKDL